MIRRGLAAVLVVLAAAARAEDPGSRDEIAAIRERIASLDLEGALGSVERLLQRPGLTEDERADALALRAGAHVALGDLEAAEADYRSILSIRPDFAPDPALATKKSLERLARLQASLVGSLHLDLDPRDAQVSVDDRPVSTTAGSIKVLAGERRLRAVRSGFDPLEVPVRAVAGAETLVTLRLVPNARSIVVRTDVPGVEVLLDGTNVGETVATAGGAELLVPDVPLGEHAVELRKPCFSTETISAFVSVDLSDRSPKALPIVSLRPAASRFRIVGADYPGELRVDGEKIAALPLDAFTVCPGPRVIEVVASGRTVWRGTIEAEEAEQTLDLSARPSVVLLGDEWPESWRDFAGSVSLRGRIEAPAGRDLSAPEAWKDLALPPDTDLAVAVRAPRLAGERPRVLVYAPALDAVEEAESPLEPGRPVWSGTRLDADLVDGPGMLLVAAVAPGGAADRAGLRAGDRIAAVGGTEVDRASAARARLDTFPVGSTVTLTVLPPGGAPRAVSLPAAQDPRIVVPEDELAAVVRAAWASAEGAAGGPRAASALANLAVLLESRRHDAAAAEAWRRAKALDASAFGLRADYALASDLAGRGKKAEAIELFRKVRDAAGPAGAGELGAAAGDRLVDLGVAP